MRFTFVNPWRLVAVLALSPALSLPLVISHERGMWPSSWPVELEALRGRSQTHEIATGIQQDIHQIPFSQREEFERIWPFLRQLTSAGSIVTLFSVGSDPPADWGSLLSNRRPAVRVYAPPHGSSLWHALPSPSRSGGAFVHRKTVNGLMVWVPSGDSLDYLAFHFRYRTDLDLVVDGSVIDLERISMPKGRLVIDMRSYGL